MARVQACTAMQPNAHTKPRRGQQIIYGMGCSGRSLAQPTARKKLRKLPQSELIEMLDLAGVRHLAIRPLGAYTPRSADIRKQLVRLVEHMFVEYGVPEFLYASFMRGEAPFDFAHEMYRMWLVALGQGHSFPRLVQPHMSSREAHVFL